MSYAAILTLLATRGRADHGDKPSNHESRSYGPTPGGDDVLADVKALMGVHNEKRIPKSRVTR